MPTFTPAPVTIEQWDGTKKRYRELVKLLGVDRVGVGEGLPHESIVARREGRPGAHVDELGRDLPVSCLVVVNNNAAGRVQTVMAEPGEYLVIRQDGQVGVLREHHVRAEYPGVLPDEE